VRSHAIYWGYGRRCNWRHRTSLLSGVHGRNRRVCARRHGHALCRLPSRQDGIELPSLEESREEELLRVEDAMRTPATPPLRAEKTIEQVRGDIENSEQEWLLIYDRTRGWLLARKADVLEKGANAPP